MSAEGRRRLRHRLSRALRGPRQPGATYYREGTFDTRADAIELAIPKLSFDPPPVGCHYSFMA